MIVITMNGDKAELPDGTVLEGLIVRNGIDSASRGIAIAVNGEVVPRGMWAVQAVNEGDIVELLTASQGG